MLVNLLRNDRRSFPSDSRFRAAQDSLEIHHLFARNFLDEETDGSIAADRLGNLTPLFRRDNNDLDDTPPAVYLADLVHRGQQEQLLHHDIPRDPALWQPDRYEDFCEEREKLLAGTVRALLQELLGASATPGAPAPRKT